MKKLALTAMAILLSVSGLLNAAGAKEARSKTQPRFTLEVGTFHPPGTGDVEGLQQLKKMLEERSGGQIAVDISYGETLGKELDTIEQARLGTMHVVTDGLGTMGRYGPKFATWTVPYAYSAETLARSAEGPIGQAIKKRMETDGLYFGGIIPMGYRNLTSNRKAIEPDAIKGMKLRLPDNKQWMTVWQGFGVLPTSVAINELYLALQTGLVDAQENPYTAIKVRKLWEVQKYVILTRHITDFHIVVLNKPFIDKLSEADRKLVLDGIADMVKWQTKYVADMEDALKAEILKNGMEIVEPNLAAYRQIALKSWPTLAAQWEPWVFEQMVKETAK